MRELVKAAVEAMRRFKYSHYNTDNFIMKPAFVVMEICSEAIESNEDYRVFMRCAADFEVANQCLEEFLDSYEDCFNKALQTCEATDLIAESYKHFYEFLNESYDMDEAEPYAELYSAVARFLLQIFDAKTLFLYLGGGIERLESSTTQEI